LGFGLLFLVALMVPLLNKVKSIANGPVCGINLKGLGTAMQVYANDYAGSFPEMPGEGPWAKELGFDYRLARPDFATAGLQSATPRTITASWYLLVREADVSPKCFVCPHSKQACFDGQNSANLDITEFWDFGPDPYKHVSYALHNPYGQFPAGEDRGAAFAVAADMSPWFVNGDIVPPGAGTDAPQLLGDHWSKPDVEKGLIMRANTSHHSYEGQNVVYADGHSSYEKTTDAGVAHDNIYTFWPTETNPTEAERRTGQNPTARDKQNDAKSKEDSFLAI